MVIICVVDIQSAYGCGIIYCSVPSGCTMCCSHASRSNSAPCLVGGHSKFTLYHNYVDIDVAEQYRNQRDCHKHCDEEDCVAVAGCTIV